MSTASGESHEGVYFDQIGVSVTRSAGDRYLTITVKGARAHLGVSAAKAVGDALLKAVAEMVEKNG